MPLGTSSFLYANYHKTYMEQLCEAIHPEFLEMGTICVAWFRQAAKHCTDLLSNAKPPSTLIWQTVKNFIFPDRTTDMVSQNIPINIDPNRLSIHDCQSLFLDVVSDYVQRAPRYVVESEVNVMLWQVLHSIMGTMALGCLVLFIYFAYNKYSKAKPVMNYFEEFFKPEKREQAVAKRSLNLGKAELRNIHIKPLARMEDIIANDGLDVLALKIGQKYEFLESVVEGKLQTVGKFHRHSLYHKSKDDFKVESLKKAMRFLDNNCKKLHLLIMFEDDVEFEEALAARKQLKSNSSSIRSLSPLSPRVKALSSFPSGRLEAGGATSTPIRSGSTSPLTLPKSPRSNTTPRLGGPDNSSIPRKRPCISRKSK